jgi:prophage DNA circulation protein
MAWRDELQRVDFGGKRLIGGSFRGVPFLLDEAQYAGGRRLAGEEFPYSDDWFDDDLGRARREYQTTAYVIGQNYLQAKTKLIEALEESGPGELVHPYYGKGLTVRCESFTVTERKEEGGRAVFSISFRATGDGSLVIAQVQSVPSITAKANAQLATSYQAVATANAVDGDFLTPIENAVKDFGDKIRKPFEAISKAGQSGANFRSRLNKLVDNAASVVVDPIDLTIATGELMASSAFDAPALPSSLLRLIGLAKEIFDDLVKNNQQASPFDTETRAKQTILLRTTAEYLATTTLLTVADLCADASYESYDDAAEIRNAIGAALDERCSEPGFEDAQSSLEQARAASLALIPANSEGSFLRQFYTPTINTPATVLAYQFYGSTANELRLIARNKGIRNPCIVRGALPVEVLREL